MMSPLRMMACVMLTAGCSGETSASGDPSLVDRPYGAKFIGDKLRVTSEVDGLTRLTVFVRAALPDDVQVSCSD